MTTQQMTDADIADIFKYAPERLCALSKRDHDKSYILACQASYALRVVLFRPREELSDDVLVEAVGLAVSDMLCNAVERERFDELAQRTLDVIKVNNDAMVDFDFTDDWILPRLSRAEEGALVARAAEALERRVRYEDWQASIFGGEDRLHYEEFGRRAQINPSPSGPLEPFWQIKRDCKELIARLEENDPIAVAAKALLEATENECGGISSLTASGPE